MFNTLCVSRVTCPNSHVMCHMSHVSFFLLLLKASALWADAFYKLKCPSVCPSVCLSVCSLLKYRLNVFLPPLPEVRCPIFLEIRNSWGKVVERNGLRYEHFCLKIVENCRAKKVIFLLILPYKTWGKPRFPMNQRLLVKGRIANFGISLDVFEFLRFG